ncbi:Bug family tripartite tricarboxylate transporter substrate binding protein [Ramlibacter sp. MAHUQ-53]|uniref:Bug family tripartite tricarboxylate transporter substrate binding protein n=1 Tax=unclassified Ramlibacter TaxID=2617605 RepID=UPI0036388E2E
MKTRHFLQALALGAALAAGAAPAFAQAWPARPVKMIVPFPAGSATDLAARVMAQQLGATLGQGFVVENKPGAGGSIAAMEVVRAAPDGYTLLFSSNSALASNVALLKSMPYDPVKDLAAVAGVGETTLALMVKTEHPAKNLAEFLAYLRARPGKVSAGFGSSSSQVSIAVLNKLAKTDAQLVPYKGIPLAVNDVLAGVVDFTFVDLGNSMAQAKGGKMRALGVTSPQRSTLTPDWPALAESLPGFDITAWFAIAGPASLPRDVAEKLNGAVAQALRQAEVKDRLAGIGLQPMPMGPDQLKAFMASEVTKWVRLAKEANVQPE